MSFLTRPRLLRDPADPSSHVNWGTTVKSDADGSTHRFRQARDFSQVTRRSGASFASAPPARHRAGTQKDCDPERVSGRDTGARARGD